MIQDLRLGSGTTDEELLKNVVTLHKALFMTVKA
jgi:hypothetical protein